jgi:hypothetical protein
MKQFIITTLIAMTMATSVNAMESNPIKPCEPHVKSLIQSYKSLGLQYGEVAEALATGAKNGTTYQRCTVDTEDGKTGVTFATCRTDQCTAQYYGWFAKKAK